MLRIKDPDASLKFYNDCFGLHVVFVFNAGPWTIYYLGPRDVCEWAFPNTFVDHATRCMALSARGGMGWCGVICNGKIDL